MFFVFRACSVVMGNLSLMFPTALDLDRDLERVGLLLESSERDSVSAGSIDFPGYFVGLRPQPHSKFLYQFLAVILRIITLLSVQST